MAQIDQRTWLLIWLMAYCKDGLFQEYFGVEDFGSEELDQPFHNCSFHFKSLFPDANPAVSTGTATLSAESGYDLETSFLASNSPAILTFTVNARFMYITEINYSFDRYLYYGELKVEYEIENGRSDILGTIVENGVQKIFTASSAGQIYQNILHEPILAFGKIHFIFSSPVKSMDAFFFSTSPKIALKGCKIKYYPMHITTHIWDEYYSANNYTFGAHDIKYDPARIPVTEKRNFYINTASSEPYFTLTIPHDWMIFAVAIKGIADEKNYVTSYKILHQISGTTDNDVWNVYEESNEGSPQTVFPGAPDNIYFNMHVLKKKFYAGKVRIIPESTIIETTDIPMHVEIYAIHSEFDARPMVHYSTSVISSTNPRKYQLPLTKNYIQIDYDRFICVEAIELRVNNSAVIQYTFAYQSSILGEGTVMNGRNKTKFTSNTVEILNSSLCSTTFRFNSADFRLYNSVVDYELYGHHAIRSVVGVYDEEFVPANMLSSSSHFSALTTVEKVRIKQKQSIFIGWSPNKNDVDPWVQAEFPIMWRIFYVVLKTNFYSTNFPFLIRFSDGHRINSYLLLSYYMPQAPVFYFKSLAPANPAFYRIDYTSQLVGKVFRLIFPTAKYTQQLNFEFLGNARSASRNQGCQPQSYRYLPNPHFHGYPSYAYRSPPFGRLRHVYSHLALSKHWTHDYLQVTFFATTKVSGIAFQGHSHSKSWVKTATVSYTMYRTYKWLSHGAAHKVLNGYDSDNATFNDIGPSFIASAIRVYSALYVFQPALRVEVYGEIQAYTKYLGLMTSHPFLHHHFVDISSSITSARRNVRLHIANAYAWIPNHPTDMFPFVQVRFELKYLIQTIILQGYSSIIFTRSFYVRYLSEGKLEYVKEGNERKIFSGVRLIRPDDEFIHLTSPIITNVIRMEVKSYAAQASIRVEFLGQQPLLPELEFPQTAISGQVIKIKQTIMQRQNMITKHNIYIYTPTSSSGETAGSVIDTLTTDEGPWISKPTSYLREVTNMTVTKENDAVLFGIPAIVPIRYVYAKHVYVKASITTWFKTSSPILSGNKSSHYIHYVTKFHPDMFHCIHRPLQIDLDTSQTTELELLSAQIIDPFFRAVPTKSFFYLDMVIQHTSESNFATQNVKVVLYLPKSVAFGHVHEHSSPQHSIKDITHSIEENKQFSIATVIVPVIFLNDPLRLILSLTPTSELIKDIDRIYEGQFSMDIFYCKTYQCQNNTFLANRLFSFQYRQRCPIRLYFMNEQAYLTTANDGQSITLSPDIIGSQYFMVNSVDKDLYSISFKTVSLGDYYLKWNKKNVLASQYVQDPDGYLQYSWKISNCSSSDLTNYLIRADIPLAVSIQGGKFKLRDPSSDFCTNTLNCKLIITESCDSGLSLDGKITYSGGSALSVGNTGEFFVCQARRLPEKRIHTSICYSTFLNSLKNTWKALPTYVIGMVGYHYDTGVVYGIHISLKAYLKLLNIGIWVLISDAELNAALSSSSFKRATNVEDTEYWYPKHTFVVSDSEEWGVFDGDVKLAFNKAPTTKFTWKCYVTKKCCSCCTYYNYKQLSDIPHY